MSTRNEPLHRGADAFIAWAREHAVPVGIPREDEDFDDLAFMDEVVRGKPVVAVGESAHYLHEWNRWRARLFKYLVREHGFSVFALESALIEGRRVHEYVAGADYAWDSIAQAINNVWGVWAELNELIRWMRAWNLDPNRSRELRFYSIDGSGNWNHPRHAYRAVLDFATEVDGDLAADFAREFESAAAELTLETREAVGAERFRALIGAASLFVSRIEQARVNYTEASSFEAYRWGLRCAEVFRDVLLAIGQTEADFNVGVRQFWNVRDVSMAESLHWIREYEGMDAGIVIGAHNTHLQRYPVRDQRATSMGSYYSSRFGGDDLLLIGTASERSVKGELPRPDSNQAIYAEVGPECYFLDLRQAPAAGPVAEWLGVERPDRSNLRYQPVCAGKAWDCLIYHRTLRTGEVEWPSYLASPKVEYRAEQLGVDLEALAGRYVIYGFLAAVNTLDVFVEDGVLYSDGQDDTSGELFPPYRASVHYCADGRFRWDVFPTIIEFHPVDGEIRVSMTTPGGALYHGERIGASPRA